MRVLDVVLAIPTLLMAIAVLAVFGASIPALILVLGFRSMVYYARTLRSRVLTVREEQYVKAARAVGLPTWRILLRHIAPQTIAPLVVLSAIYLGLMIIVESSLSFLGLSKVHVSWGFMCAENLNYISTAWWTVTLPGLAIFVVVFSVNVIGDFLRDVFDPRLQPRLG
jgi:peptide/nickel transport system permease protein